ncbi:uncharacterized protein LODBEIA_P45540 [Lodderomyces beijingensis]|uniref:Chromatin structure-remodeling complex protein RSC7 n=1 Tax=Lodderomyces beijingensis TaxID=1775926 RepID=A0ABP0ZQ95_9ASCO
MARGRKSLRSSGPKPVQEASQIVKEESKNKEANTTEAEKNQDADAEDENQESKPEAEEEEEQLGPTPKKRKVAQVDDDEEEGEAGETKDSLADDDDEADADNNNNNNNGDGEEEDGEEEDGEEEENNNENDNEDDDDDDDDDEENLKKRGRKKKKKSTLFKESDVFDSDGNPIDTSNDEVRIPNEDPLGCAKIDSLGNLTGNREFRMRTFKILGEGDRLYMISTGPARLVGFRDSYLLFKTHKTLFKRVCDYDQKMDLIQRGIIPNSYKGRAVNLVSARSIFREFGARMIKEGKKVIDDFWEARAVANGDVAGEYADPDEFYKSKLSSLLGDGSSGGAGGGLGVGGMGIGSSSTPLAPVPIVNYQTDETWLYQIAKQSSEYNSKLAELRLGVAASGVRDVFTNTIHFPVSLTQARTCTVSKLGQGKELVRDVVFKTHDLRRPIVGLADVPREIIDEIEDEEIRHAALEQQEYERSSVVL